MLLLFFFFLFFFHVFVLLRYFQDFGIKYNCENGGPAPEKLTNLIYENTKSIAAYKSCEAFPEVDVTVLGPVGVTSSDGSRSVVVDVVSLWRRDWGWWERITGAGEEVD